MSFPVILFHFLMNAGQTHRGTVPTGHPPRPVGTYEMIRPIRRLPKFARLMPVDRVDMTRTPLGRRLSQVAGSFGKQIFEFALSEPSKGCPIKQDEAKPRLPDTGQGKVPASFRSPSITREAGRLSGSKVSARFMCKFLRLTVTLNHEGKSNASTAEG